MIPLARVALLRLARDRSNLFFVVVFPLLLVVLLGVQFGSAGPDTTVLVAGPSSPLRAAVVDAVDGDDVDVLLDDDPSAARTAVEDGDVDAAVAVPRPVDDGPVAVEVHAVAGEDTGLALRTQVDGAVAEASVPLGAARALEGLGLAVDATSLDPAATDVVVDETVVGGDSGDSLEEAFSGLGQFDLGASSMLLLFVFITALTASAGIVQSRRWGVVDRIVAGPTTPATVVAGLALGQFAVALAQALLIVVVTAIAFGVNWGDPLASGLVVVTFCATAAAGGLLLGAWLDSEERVGGVAPPVALVLAALGGSMVPLELFPEWLRGVANVTPHAWANDAFAEIVRRGGGVADVAPNLLVLTLYALVLGGIATALLQRQVSRR